MRKLLFIFLFAPLAALAEGPILEHKETVTQQEFENVYKDLRTKMQRDNVTVSSWNVTSNASISSLTVTSQFNVPGGIEVNSSGEVTKPRQPSFLVTDNGGAANVTGDGTAYTLTWNAEVYDQASNFASDTFTAPVTGKYLLSLTASFQGVTAAETVRQLRIVTSNRTYIDVDDSSAVPGNFGMHLCVIADMDAGDTATGVAMFQNGAKVVDMLGDSRFNTFSGSLIN